jgi:hypothetical protein
MAARDTGVDEEGQTEARAEVTGQDGQIAGTNLIAYLIAYPQNDCLNWASFVVSCRGYGER